MRRFWTFLLVASGLGFLVLAGMLRDPLVYSRRPLICWALLFPLIMTGWAGLNKRWFLMALFGCSLLIAAVNEGRFYSQKQFVLSAPAEKRWQFGQHMIVGFRDRAMIEELVNCQGIGGIFLSGPNVEGYRPEEVRRWIDGLQQIQKANGLPPLRIACDQEGGVVSRMTPPLPQGEALSSFVKNGVADSAAAEAWGQRQGEQLVSMGINMNFSPVVDVPISSKLDSMDHFSQIPTRAIASSPELVAAVALGYSRGLLEAGVLPVAKHFPGLGRVKKDTHLFSAELEMPFEDWRKSDGIPFRGFKESGVSAGLMLSHVIFTDIDPDNPASVSRAVVHLARDQFGEGASLVTDDINMRPAFHRKGGVGRSAKDALDAGVDWILISYMGETYFPIMVELLKDSQGRAIQ